MTQLCDADERSSEAYMTSQLNLSSFGDGVSLRARKASGSRKGF